MQQKTIPTNATHGNTYTILFYPRQAPSHKHLHKTHKIKEKRSRDFPFRVVPVGPLVRAESWQNGRALCLDRAVSGLRAGRLGPCSPFLVVDDSREGCADSRAEGEHSMKKTRPRSHRAKTIWSTISQKVMDGLVRNLVDEFGR